MSIRSPSAQRIPDRQWPFPRAYAQALLRVVMLLAVHAFAASFIVCPLAVLVEASESASQQAEMSDPQEQSVSLKKDPCGLAPVPWDARFHRGHSRSGVRSLVSWGTESAARTGSGIRRRC